MSSFSKSSQTLYNETFKCFSAHETLATESLKVFNLISESALESCLQVNLICWSDILLRLENNQQNVSFCQFLISQSFWHFFTNQTYLLLGKYTNMNSRSRKVLKVHWSDLHLSSLSRVVISFPCPPVYTISANE